MSTPRGWSGRTSFSTRSASRISRATPTLSGDAFETLRLAGKALGLPTSLLIDARGCEIGAVAGPANWSSPEALAAVKALQGG